VNNVVLNNILPEHQSLDYTSLCGTAIARCSKECDEGRKKSFGGGEF